MELLAIKLINYIYFVYQTAKFNLIWYKMHHKADISIFDKCSWKSYVAYKQYKKDGERSGQGNF